MAGRQGDGWLPVAIKDPATYERRLADVRTAAADAGRPPDAVLPALELNLMVAPTRREVRALMESRVARFTGAMASARVWREVGATHPFGEDFGGYTDILPERLDPEIVEEAIRVVPRDVVERTFLFGTPDQLRRQIEELRDAGLRAICFIPGSLETPRQVSYTFWALGRIARRLH